MSGLGDCDCSPVIQRCTKRNCPRTSTAPNPSPEELAPAQQPSYEAEKLAGQIVLGDCEVRKGQVTESIIYDVALALDAFAASARAEERERCAKFCDERSAWAEQKITDEIGDMWANYSNACDDCASVIRAGENLHTAS